MLPLTLAGALLGCGDDGGQQEEPRNAGLPSCYEPTHTAEADWQDAFDASAQGAFLSVWGTGPCDVYTVGGQPGAGVMFRFDGAAWSKVTIPQSPMLNWVHGVDGQLWIVGEQGLSMRGTPETGFEILETGVDAPLWGVWATASDDVWAVGGDVIDFDAEPVLLHFDGTAWSQETLPQLDRPAQALFKVQANGPDDVLAVGQSGVALRYDGTTWTQLSSGTGDDLISLWGLGDGPMAVIGGRSNAVLARYDGAALQSETLAGLPGMNGVWMDAEGTSHVVGIFGSVARIPAGGFEAIPETTPTQEVLHGTWGVDGGPRFAVGGSLNRSPPFIGVVLMDP